MLKKILIFTAVILAASEVHATHGAADTLDVAVVTAEKGMIVSRSDIVSLEKFRETGQALMNIPGLTVTDMGGNAGLKTVSLRGLGTAHTSIYIDGIRIGNLQSGQPDIGMIGTDFFKTAVIDYAQNSIDFITAAPTFNDKKTSTELAFTGGSFSTYMPSLKFGWKLTDKITMSIYANGTFSKGDFTYYGHDIDGNKAEMRRAGNDITRIRASIDFFGEGWKIKAYANTSERGTPGSISWMTDDRQSDLNTLLQGSYNKAFSRLYQLKASVKGSYDEMKYLSSWGDSKYRQTELQLNTSHIFRIKEWWSASIALGCQSDKLESGNYGTDANGIPSAEGITRIQLRSAVATRFSLNRFIAEMSLEYETIRDKENRTTKLSLNPISPSASLRFGIIDGLDIVAFGRRAYRTPMFNELYYIGFGNQELKPEDAWLTDIGAEWTCDISTGLTLSAKADGFFNWLENKITSAPSDYDPNIWLPYNIGKVFSSGYDISASLKYTFNNWTGGFSIRHTFQNALDKTPDSVSYGKQIAYVAKNSIVIAGDAAWKGWKLDLRYNLRCGRSDSSGELPDWNTLDACISKDISLFRKPSYPGAKASLTVNNLTDTRYELSRGYPMPGRSILAGIAFTF